MRTNKKIILGTVLILNAIASLAHADTQVQSDQYVVNTLPVPSAIVPQPQPQDPRSKTPNLMQSSFGM